MSLRFVTESEIKFDQHMVGIISRLRFSLLRQTRTLLEAGKDVEEDMGDSSYA